MTEPTPNTIPHRIEVLDHYRRVLAEALGEAAMQTEAQGALVEELWALTKADYLLQRQINTLRSRLDSLEMKP